jgi:hypothetical protein
LVAGQTFPHIPQLLLSLSVWTQVPLQTVGALAGHWHLPPPQERGEQQSALVVHGMNTGEQEGLLQTPLVHTWPAGQLPQLSTPPQPSLIMPQFTPAWAQVLGVQLQTPMESQVPEQQGFVALHPIAPTGKHMAQAPLAQTWPDAHTMPHAPQLFGSVVGSTHLDPQRDCVAEQLGRPLHAANAAPQLAVTHILHAGLAVPIEPVHSDRQCAAAQSNDCT